MASQSSEQQNSQDSQQQQQQAEVPPQRSSRQSGGTQLPLTRVKAIIKADPDTSLTSQDAILLIAKATELFIGYLAQQSHVFTVQARRKTVQRRDIDACIPIHDELAFLEGTLDS